MKVRIAGLSAILLSLALAVPVSAHPGHGSCAGFGAVSAALGQAHELADLIRGVIAENPRELGDIVALEHSLFCAS